MEARVDRRLDVLREEVRRSLQRDCFDAAIYQLAITRQAGKAARLVDTQRITCGIRHLLEIVGHGVHLVAAVLLKEAGDPLTAATTADHAQFYLASRCCRIRRLASHGV